MENTDRSEPKLEWETPSAKVVGLMNDVRGSIGFTGDEDFTGIPS